MTGKRKHVAVFLATHRMCALHWTSRHLSENSWITHPGAEKNILPRDELLEELRYYKFVRNRYFIRRKREEEEDNSLV